MTSSLVKCVSSPSSLGPGLLVSPVLSLLSLSQGLSVWSDSSDLPVFGGLYPSSSLSAQILISLLIFIRTWWVLPPPAPGEAVVGSLSPSHFSNGGTACLLFTLTLLWLLLEALRCCVSLFFCVRKKILIFFLILSLVHCLFKSKLFTSRVLCRTFLILGAIMQPNPKSETCLKHCEGLERWLGD